MLPIFWCAPQIGLFCSTCCWKKFLASGDPPGCLWKNLKNEKFSLKKWKSDFFRFWEIKIDSQRAGEVPFDFLVCHGVLLLIDVYHPRKKFLTRRTPIIENIAPRNPRKWRFSDWKSRIQQMEGRNFCGEGCRNFWHFEGTLQHPKFVDTKSWKFLIFIRGVTNFWKLLKLIKSVQI